MQIANLDLGSFVKTHLRTNDELILFKVQVPHILLTYLGNEKLQGLVLSL